MTRISWLRSLLRAGRARDRGDNHNNDPFLNAENYDAIVQTNVVVVPNNQTGSINAPPPPYSPQEPPDPDRLFVHNAKLRLEPGKPVQLNAETVEIFRFGATHSPQIWGVQFPAREVEQPDKMPIARLTRFIGDLEKDATTRLSLLLTRPTPNEANDPTATFEHGNQTTAQQIVRNRYTISAIDWREIGDEGIVRVVLGDKDDETTMSRLESVLFVYAIVYSSAKIFVAICERFGVELDNSPTGLLFHIQRVEAVLRSDDISTLIHAIEGLFYVLFARLSIELGNVQICNSFSFDIRHLAPLRLQDLPEPSYLYKILYLFKRYLEAHDVCQLLDKELIERHQEQFIQGSIERYQDQESSTRPSSAEFRGHVQHILESRDASQWHGLQPIQRMTPGAILAFLAEKYLGVEAPEHVINTAERRYRNRLHVEGVGPEQGFGTMKDLGNIDHLFVGPEDVSPEIWDRNTILAHRAATLAKLEGKSVGEVRREDDSGYPLIDFVKERRCICVSACFCARNCTYDPESPCPCSDRSMRMLLLETPLENVGECGVVIAESVVERLWHLQDQSYESIDYELFTIFVVFKELIDEHRLLGRPRMEI